MCVQSLTPINLRVAVSEVYNKDGNDAYVLQFFLGEAVALFLLVAGVGQRGKNTYYVCSLFLTQRKQFDPRTDHGLMFGMRPSRTLSWSNVHTPGIFHRDIRGVFFECFNQAVF